jgi:phosphate transport system permease protein
MANITSVPQATPRKPWSASPKDRIKSASILVAAALVSFAVVAATPLKGKLAFFAVFFFAFLVIDFVVAYLKAGRPAAIDSFFRGLVTMAIVVAVTPILSILTTVWLRGHHGLHLSLFTASFACLTSNSASRCASLSSSIRSFAAWHITL